MGMVYRGRKCWRGRIKGCEVEFWAWSRCARSCFWAVTRRHQTAWLDLRQAAALVFREAGTREMGDADADAPITGGLVGWKRQVQSKSDMTHGRADKKAGATRSEPQ